MNQKFLNDIYSNIPLSDYAIKDVFIINPNDNLAFARKMMLKNNISKLVMLENNKIAGILSLRDIALILMQIHKKNTTLDQLLVKNHVKHPVVTLEKNRSVKEACKAMNDNKIGSVVVTNKDELAGIFTPTDACRVFNDYPIEDIKVEDVMDKQVEKVNRLSSVRKIIKMFKEDTTVLLVEDNKKIVGIITLSNIASLDESEFLSKQMKYIRGNVSSEKIKTEKVAADVMYEIDIALSASDKLLKAVNYLLRFDLPALPVIDDNGNIIGVLSKKDIVKLIAR